jgi:two-component system, OmpR family, response regulator
MNRNDLKTILYVDDEPDIREVVQMSLSLVDGLDVQVCESGERALQLLPEIKPDLLLLDVMMPGMDGPSTLQKMRSIPALAKIPVVFMTAKAMPQEVARFRELGAASVIAKPFDPIQLGNQVVAVWEGIADE